MRRKYYTSALLSAIERDHFFFLRQYAGYQKIQNSLEERLDESDKNARHVNCHRLHVSFIHSFGGIFPAFLVDLEKAAKQPPDRALHSFRA